jgi:hypothetical protein
VIPEQAAAGIRAASQVLNIEWIAEALDSPASVICPRSGACASLTRDMSTRPYWMHLRGWNCIPILPVFRRASRQSGLRASTLVNRKCKLTFVYSPLHK